MLSLIEACMEKVPSFTNLSACESEDNDDYSKKKKKKLILYVTSLEYVVCSRWTHVT